MHMYTALTHIYIHSLRDPKSTSRPTARQQDQLALYKSLHPPPHATYKREMSDLYIEQEQLAAYKSPHPPPHATYKREMSDLCIDPQLHASSSQGVSPPTSSVSRTY